MGVNNRSGGGRGGGSVKLVLGWCRKRQARVRRREAGQGRGGGPCGGLGRLRLGGEVEPDSPEGAVPTHSPPNCSGRARPRPEHSNGKPVARGRTTRERIGESHRGPHLLTSFTNVQGPPRTAQQREPTKSIPQQRQSRYKELKREMLRRERYPEARPSRKSSPLRHGDALDVGHHPGARSSQLGQARASDGQPGAKRRLNGHSGGTAA